MLYTFLFMEMLQEMVMPDMEVKQMDDQFMSPNQDIKMIK